MIPPLFPKEPPTGYAHPKCYLRGTNDCCRKLSREHYISEAVLRTVRGGLQVSGGFWSGEKPKDITVETLVSKILCKRHNESLTSLDAAAGELFAAIAEVYDDFKAGSTSTGSSFHVCSGLMFELWCLKVIWGVHHAGTTTAQGAKTRDSYGFDTARLMEAFVSRRLEAPCGLYAYAQRQRVKTGVSVMPIGTHDPERIGGVEIGVHGVRFDVIFDPSAVYRDRIQHSAYRPSEITFTDATRSHVIILSWPPGRLLVPDVVVNVLDVSGRQ
jgi:hypothetical protein